MGKILINQEKVTPDVAREAVKICPFNAIYYENGKLGINAACRMCKICVKKGPAGIFSYVEEEIIKAIDKGKWVGIAVFIEHGAGGIHPVSFELIGKAKELAAVIKHPVYAVLFADDVAKYTDELLSYGVDKVYAYQHSAFNHFNVEIYTNTMEDFISKIKPSVILYGGTSIGRSFAPRVAARFKTGLTADCTILGMKPNTDLIQNRPAFGGNIMAGIVCPNHRPQMATVRYKIFKKPEKVKPHGKVVMMNAESLPLSTNIKLIEIKPKPKEIDISEADTILALGRPFKSEDDFVMAREFADLMGAQIAGTRPLVEAGLIDPRKQIGLSGRTVAPKLLITLGVSGAVQFTAGMTGSEIVFSVCSDPHAPIFDVAHYGLVGNLFEIVPKLIDEIKKQKGLK